MAELPDDALFAKAVSHALSKVGKIGMDLKPELVQAIRHLYEGRDVFLWLPTGFGKSICYEILPFLFDFKLGQADIKNSMVLVVSPLLSLMIDQVSSL